MKEHLLVLIILAAANNASQAAVLQRNEPVCNPGDDYFAAGPECYNFYSCRNGVIEIIECPVPLLWNDDRSRCDQPENVQCEDGEPTVTTEAPPTQPPTSPPTTSNTFMPGVDGALPILFPGSECPPDIRAFLVHETDCQLFFYCLDGIKHPQTCPFLQKFDIVLGHCVPRDQPYQCFPGSE
uniref:Chitin-binding type-2 domain-containing protein n=1 Tax=Anopheles minimus TaxID=112268 RepID=A0A182W3W5_9DIPT